MNNYHKFLKTSVVSALLIAELGIFLGTKNPLLAETKVNSSNKQKVVTFVPPGNLQPKSSAGGASRSSSSCNAETAFTSCLMPLIPSQHQGLTLASHPSFLVYIPENAQAESGFLSLKDAHDNDYYQAKIDLKGKVGIVKITLPNDAPDLEVGGDYKWSLAMMSDLLLKPDTPFVQGYVTRVASESQLKEQLSAATPLEEASIYGKAGLWYETVATLASLKQANPNDAEIGTQWQQLLNSVGLEKIATQPFAE
jgi:hypothetical protein